MTNKTIRLVQRAAVIAVCVLLPQSFLYSQTVNNETLPPVVKQRLSFDLNKPKQITFNPISKLLAVQREDGSVQIVDLTDGHEQTVLPLADKALYSMKWTADGLRLFVIDTKSASLWDARTGTRLSTPIEIRRDKDFSIFGEVTLSPDEKFLLNVKKDESIKAMILEREKRIAQVWSLESGQLKFQIKAKGTYGLVRFSPNGKQILTTSEKEDPKLWDVETGRLFTTLTPPLRPLFREGSHADFSPDGRFVIQSHETGTYIWYSSSGALNTSISSLKNGGDGLFRGFTPDGKMFATLHTTGGWHSKTSFEFRDCETGEVRSTLRAPKWEGWPDQVLWSRDGRTLVVASGNDKYEGRIWDIGTGRFKAIFPMVLKYYRIPMALDYKDRDDLAIHPSLPIVSASNNKFIRLWNADTGELMQKIDNDGHHGEWSADGKLFLTFSKDLKSAQVWDVVL